MATYIFQSNPDTFDIDSYLSACTGDFWFLVTRHKSEIAVGDTVYIWRAIGKQGDSELAGVIAEAAVTGPAEFRPTDPESIPYWKDSLDANVPNDRVPLRLLRLANKKEVLKREWLKDDSILSGLAILKQAAGTNFSVSSEQAQRLSRLWANTGRDWTESEIVAAMKLYAEVWNQPISKIKGSRVEQVAQLIGRAPTGVYNKLMNFRALDSRVDAKGFTGGSKADAVVWDRYFDAANKTILRADLDTEFDRLWSDTACTVLIAPEEGITDEVRRLAGKSLAELMSAYAKAPRPPASRKSRSVPAYTRSPLVVAITLLRADWKCEIATCTSPRFEDKDGVPLVEVHHLRRLADGGPDEISNTVCVCANHHRALHYSTIAAKLRDELAALRANVSDRFCG